MKKNIKKLKSNVSKSVSRGRELLTVMFIPHSEKRIFTFQISYLTIVFTCFLLISLVGVAFYALKKQPETLEKQRSFEYKNEKYMSVLNRFMGLTKNIVNENKRIKKSFYQLLVSSGYSKKNKPKGKSFKISKNIYQNLPSDKYIIEIQKLSQYANNVKTIVNKSKPLINSIKTFKNLSRVIPSIWPLVGTGIVTSGYGPRIDPFTMRPMFHPGVDISAFAGTPVRATASGVVKYASFAAGTGNMVQIEHKFGYMSAYCHLQRFAVEEGDVVRRGEIIGYVGNTGRSAGPHLHYEVRIKNVHINPQPFLRLDVF
jgi:murein DD-endopeptidase MepM/ murein hydrolase activator NlpD